MPPAFSDFRVPVEEADVFDFTPKTLEDIEHPPVFRLRAYTDRDRLHRKHMERVNNVRRYSVEELRDVIRAELKKLWGYNEDPTIYDREIPRLEEYWQATDDHQQQLLDDPDLKFDFDEDEEKAIEELQQRLERESKLLREMTSRNAIGAEQSMYINMAVIVKGFDNVDVNARREDGYLTLETVADLMRELENIEKRNKKLAGTAFMELLVACVDRMRLPEGAEKNSASPSPSGRGQKSSKTRPARSKSRASAKSPKSTSGE